MSFVGTRPEAVRYVEKYKPEYYASTFCMDSSTQFKVFDAFTSDSNRHLV